jgi:hypothetical protein
VEVDVDRLSADPAVGAFVADALLLTDGDAERAADLMLLRLAQAHPEDASVLRLVVAEALAHAAALDGPMATRAVRVRAAAQRERAAALCDRSQDVLARAQRLRTWANECLHRVHAVRYFARLHRAVPG